MTDDKKKYNFMEPVLNNINSRFISISEADRKANNNILQSLLNIIISKMEESNNLFKEMFKRVFFGGSFYDGLRVGKPDEFDLDLLLALPKILKPELTTSNKPGFVQLQFKQYANFLKQLDLVVRYKGLDKLIDEKQYLNTSKVLKWMESVVTQALNTFPKNGSESVIEIKEGTFYTKICKAGPAFTLKVRGQNDLNIDVDLVPCFIFSKEKWPQNGFKKNPVATKPDFFIVPKPLKGELNYERFWRVSFQEQERVTMSGNKTLKPTIKLLKKMRDQLDHCCIASYYLKIILLWEAEKHDSSYWNNSLSYVFMNSLKEYQKQLEQKNIPYFWNKNYNLIENVKDDTLLNLNNKVKAIIDDIENHPNDPYVVAKYILTKSELVKLKEESMTTGMSKLSVK